MIDLRQWRSSRKSRVTRRVDAVSRLGYRPQAVFSWPWIQAGPYRLMAVREKASSRTGTRAWWPLPPQIIRLVLLTIGIVVVYSIARFFLTPPSFHEYGWYRGNALREIAGQHPVYAGREACAECHDEEAQKLASAGHKSLACEVCHGPGQAHADAPDVDEYKPPKLSYSHCIRCHEADPSRPTAQKQIDPTDHYTGDTCTECHVPHQPSEMP